MTSETKTVDPLPPPPSTVAPPSTTAVPDLSGVPLPVARGATTTTTISIGPGAAALKGTVTAPEGPAGSAVVRVERLVGGAVAAMDLATAADGTWSLPNIRGGAYRVRAWRTPDLALVTPAFIFVGATETFTLDLKLDRYSGPFATAAVAPNPPQVGPPVNLVVQLSLRSVDDKGFVVAVPLLGAGALISSPTGGWMVMSPNPTLADANGRARWDVRCRAAGDQSLVVSVDGAPAPLPLKLAACVEAAPVGPAPAPTSPGSAPTTRKPPASFVPRPTTTTTRLAPTTTRTATTTTRPVATTTTRPR